MFLAAQWFAFCATMYVTWPRGPMDKASAYGAGDCRFESCRGHVDATILTYPRLCSASEDGPRARLIFNPFRQSGVAQWLACWAHNPKVRGSKPRSARACLRRLRESLSPSNPFCGLAGPMILWTALWPSAIWGRLPPVVRVTLAGFEPATSGFADEPKANALSIRPQGPKNRRRRGRKALLLRERRGHGAIYRAVFHERYAKLAGTMSVVI